VSVTGPRQSGKTTLIKNTFTDLPYILLEDPDTRSFAESDPRAFLNQYPNGAIFDEVQRVPSLFSYLQGVVDADPSRKFILSGSQNFLLMQNISQSLAGRVGLLTLLPFSWQETNSIITQKLPEHLLKGGYPALYQKNTPLPIFFGSYIQTYIERDVRLLKNIDNLSTFIRFVKLCAGRVGQLLNVSSLATDAGISPHTAQSWLSVLETSYIIFLLKPYHQNWGKRLTKMPKLYFNDTGLLCNLLDIANTTQLETHYGYGAIFENGIILELMKTLLNQGERPQFYFWRDSNGKEMDLIIDRNGQMIPIEIKSSQTLVPALWKGYQSWNEMTNTDPTKGYLVYGGDVSQQRTNLNLLSWREVQKIVL
jgi:predicted AAA+ superfamily ATPase